MQYLGWPAMTVVSQINPSGQAGKLVPQVINGAVVGEGIRPVIGSYSWQTGLATPATSVQTRH